MSSPSQGQTLLSESDGYIFIARYIAKAGWWYVSIYPDSAIKLAALEGPIQIVLACFVLLLCILAIVYWQVTRVVSSPLQRIASAASMLSLANYEQLLASTSLVRNSDDEVAGVLYSFRAAARRLYRRQAQLEHERDYQVQELAHVTEQLADLDELDGITTILNRRAFDRDLNEVLRTSRKEFIWLCLVEVDDFGTLLFKYGSETADTALRAVLASLNDRFPRTVYRFSATQAAILMRPQNHVDAEEIFGPLCRGVASLSIPAIRGNGSDGVTISLGVTSIEAEDTPTTVMERVHKGLNNAKGRGGNTFDFV